MVYFFNSETISLFLPEDKVLKAKLLLDKNAWFSCPRFSNYMVFLTLPAELFLLYTFLRQIADLMTGIKSQNHFVRINNRALSRGRPGCHLGALQAHMAASHTLRRLTANL